MDDQLEFHWNDIHQLDKMFSIASADANSGNSGTNAGANTEHHVSNTDRSDTPDSNHQHRHALTAEPNTADTNESNAASTAATSASTTSNTNANVHTNANMTDTTTPSNANNDYMLFLNLTTPSSVIDEQDGNTVRNKDKDTEKEKEMETENVNTKKGKKEQMEERDGDSVGGNDPTNVGAFAKFSFDSIQTSHLDFIIDQSHHAHMHSFNQQQQQQQQQNPHQLSYSFVQNAQPPSTQSRSRINSVEFTPLLSPMINSSLERVNSNKGKPGFSPLSSPVLEFQKYNNTTTLRQKRKDPHDAHVSSSNTLGNDSYHDQQQNNGNSASHDLSKGKNIKFENSDARSYKRSKTPVSTPLLSTLDRKSKISSNRNSSSTGSSTQTTPYQTYVFKQQQFPPSKDNSGSTRSSVNNMNGMESPNNSFLDAFDGDLTLPPPPTGTGQGSIAENDGFAIPSTAFMSNNGGNDLTMALNSATSMFNSSSNTSSKKNNVLLNPNHHRSAQSSPVILPSSSIPLGSPRLDPKTINTRTSHAPSGSSAFRTTINTSKFASSSSSSVNTISNMSNTNVSAVGTNILGMPQINTIPPMATSISENDGTETSPNLNAGQSSNTEHQHQHHHHHHHHTDKKMSHKLAEQGRRNRMNIAIQDLDKLIPESMKRNITVPSKATTVELGCRYIQELLQQLQNTKKGVNEDSYVGKDKLVKSESISPLDALESPNNNNHNSNTSHDISNNQV